MLNHNHFEQRDEFMMAEDQEDPMELKMRYSQGENDGADFKSILDANYNEMVSNGVFLGQEGGNQNCIDFLMPRQEGSHISFNSLNFFSASYSFGHTSQNGDDEAVHGRKKENG